MFGSVQGTEVTQQMGQKVHKRFISCICVMWDLSLPHTLRRLVAGLSFFIPVEELNQIIDVGWFFSQQSKNETYFSQATGLALNLTIQKIIFKSEGNELCRNNTHFWDIGIELLVSKRLSQKLGICCEYQIKTKFKNCVKNAQWVLAG